MFLVRRMAELRSHLLVANLLWWLGAAALFPDLLASSHWVFALASTATLVWVPWSWFVCHRLIEDLAADAEINADW